MSVYELLVKFGAFLASASYQDNLVKEGFTTHVLLSRHRLQRLALVVYASLRHAIRTALGKHRCSFIACCLRLHMRLHTSSHSHICCLVPLERSRCTASVRRIRVAWSVFDDPGRVARGDLVRRHVLYNVTVSCSHLMTSLEVQLTLVTTLPAPTVEPFPILTPGKTITLPPIQQSSSIHTSLPLSGPLVPFRTSGSRG